MNTPDMMRVGEFAVDVPATATAAQRRWLERWLNNAIADESDAAWMDVVAEEIGTDGEIRLSWLALAGDRRRQQLIIGREADGSYAEGPAEGSTMTNNDTTALPSDLQRTDTVMDVSDEPDVTAAVARIRTAVGQEFRAHGDARLAADWTNTDLAEQVYLNRPDLDARVVRVLLSRIASPTKNEDPQQTLADVAHALKTVSLIVATLAGRQLDDASGLEALVTYVDAVDKLRQAADNVSEMSGWF